MQNMDDDLESGSLVPPPAMHAQMTFQIVIGTIVLGLLGLWWSLKRDAEMATPKERKRDVLKRRVSSLVNRSKLFRKKASKSDRRGSETGGSRFFQKWKGKTLRNTRLLLGVQGPKRETIENVNTPYHLLHASDEGDDSSVLTEASTVAQAFPFLKVISESFFRQIYTSMEEVQISAGEILFSAGDHDDSAYFIKSGSLKLFMPDQGVAAGIELHSLKAGNCYCNHFSLLSSLADSESTPKTFCSAKASSRGCSLLRLRFPSLKNHTSTNNQNLMSVVRHVASEFRQAHYLVYVHVCGFLKSLSPQNPPLSLLHVTGTHNSQESIRQQGIAAIAKLLGCKEQDITKWEGVDMGQILLHTIPKDKTLVELHDGTTELSFVVEGLVKEISLGDVLADTCFGNLFYPGQFVSQGLTCLLSGEPTMTSICACSDSTVLTVPAALLSKVMEVNRTVFNRVVEQFVGGVSPELRGYDFAFSSLSLADGHKLYSQGDRNDTVYIVLSGRVRSVHNDQASNESHLVAEYGKLDVVGALELSGPVSRFTTVHAVRDSRLAAIPASIIAALGRFHPDLEETMRTREMAPKVHVKPKNWRVIGPSKSQRATEQLRTVSFVPISEGFDVSHFIKEVVDELRDLGSTVIHLNANVVEHRTGQNPNADNLSNREQRALRRWIESQENNCQLVVYEVDPGFTPWTRRCVKQADCIFLIGMGGDSSLSKMEKKLGGMATRSQTELILLHTPAVRIPSGTAKWLNLRPQCRRHFHLRTLEINSSSEHTDPLFMRKIRDGRARLARRILGKSVGLVLGGGGAKGFAHLGTIRALHDANIPIDIIGGTSIGAFVGGAYAIEEQNIDTTDERCLEMARRMQHLVPKVLDLTYPMIAMTTGRAFNRVIQKSMEELPGEAPRDILIEDLWIPFFCVSTDISNLQSRVHTYGTVWRYVRASMSLAGFLPPICDPLDGALILDGGYVNNLPVDVMRMTMFADRIIAVDVESKYAKDFINYGDAVSGTYALWKTYSPIATAALIPSQNEIQGRLAYMCSGILLQKMMAEEAFEYLRPPIDKYGTLSFGSAADIIQVGKDYAIDRVAAIKSVWENDFNFSVGDVLVGNGSPSRRPSIVNVQKVKRRVTEAVLRSPDRTISNVSLLGSNIDQPDELTDGWTTEGATDIDDSFS